jgi:hypothetical protein
MAAPDPSSPAQRSVPPVVLGIDGLPDAISVLEPGLLYGVSSDQQSLRIILIARTLEAALRAGRPCVLVGPHEAPAILRKAELVGVPLREYVADGRLWMLRRPGEAGAESPASVARWRLAELRQARIERGALVVIDRADDRFCVGDPGAAPGILASYVEWAESGAFTVLALFAPREPGGPEQTVLRALAEHFAGFAEAVSDGPEARLHVRHWFGANGTLMAAPLRLTIDRAGRILAQGLSSASAPQVDPAHELQVVTRRAATDFDGGGWRVAETVLEAIDRALLAGAATVVLHFDRAAGLRELAQAVAVLRAVGRPQLRIVVRETAGRLRLAQMIALLRLGVSMVIPRELPGPSARLMAESLRGTLFTRPHERDIDRALAGVKENLTRRALDVGAFREQAERLMGWCEALQVPATLVRFSLVSPQVARATSAALLRGARDCLFAEHPTGLWVLLFGCLPEHADAVLSRLLGAHFERLIADVRRIGDPLAILDALRLLEPDAAGTGEPAATPAPLRAPVLVDVRSGSA